MIHLAKDYTPHDSKGPIFAHGHTSEIVGDFKLPVKRKKTNLEDEAKKRGRGKDFFYKMDAAEREFYGQYSDGDFVKGYDKFQEMKADVQKEIVEIHKVLAKQRRTIEFAIFCGDDTKKMQDRLRNYSRRISNRSAYFKAVWVIEKYEEFCDAAS